MPKRFENVDTSRLTKLFPFLGQAEQPLSDELEASCQQVTLPSDQFICMAGDSCEALPLLMRGTVRVYAMSEGGRETTLYRIGPGESCILTAGCLLGALEFPAFARTETEAEALLVPIPVFYKWFTESPAWTSYVLELTSRRLAETITRINDLLYRPLETKLADFLLRQTEEGPTVARTHAEIASEIGAAREPVSRCLKNLERDGIVRLKRGSILVLDASGLSLRTALRTP